MKSILQKLYYYSPYIPIIGLFIVIFTAPLVRYTCLFEPKHFGMSILFNGISSGIIITILILIGINS